MTRNGFRGVRRGLVGGSIALLAFAGISSSALRSSAVAGDNKPADDTAAAYAQTETTVREHIRGKTFEALVSDVAEILKVRATVDPKLAAKYDALIGLIIDVQDEGVRKVCIKAIGDMKNPSLGRYLGKFLQQPNKGEIPPLMTEAVEAAGKLAPDECAQLLVNILKDSKNYTIAAAALTALGGYGESKRLRVGILRDVIATVSKDQPSVGLRYKNDDGQGPYATAKTRTGDETKARYEALSGVMVTSLNKMTSMKCASPEDWFSLWDKHKASPADLFPSQK